MQAHQVLNQVVLLPAVVGHVMFSYRLGLARPSWLLPAIAVALLSLAVLLVSVIAEINAAWHWAITLYAIIYWCCLIISWRYVNRNWEPETSPAPVRKLPQTPAFLLEAEDGRAVLVHEGCVRRALCRGGQPADALLPGWSVAAIHNELAPVVVVFLVHDDGRTARWIIDVEADIHDEPVAQLPLAVRSALRAGAKRRLQDISSRGETALAAWNTIPRTTRLELLADLEAHAGPGSDGLSATVGGWGDDPGLVLPVCSDDDLLSVLLPAGVELPILQAGTVLRHTAFLPGWAADVLRRHSERFYLLELRHDSGARATWLLDEHLSVIGDFNSLSEATKDELRLRAEPAAASAAL